MNKGDLVDAVAAHLGQSKVAASKSVEAVFHAIAAGVAQHDKVAVSGFGTFRKKYRNARKGRNPATNQEIHIPPSFTVGFTPSQMLKERLGGDDADTDQRVNGQAQRHTGHIEPKHTDQHHHHAHQDAQHGDVRLT